LAGVSKRPAREELPSKVMGVIPINSRVAATFAKNLKRGIFIATGTRRHSMAAIVTSGVQLQRDPTWAVAI
jgi:hypothetical protein